MDFQKLLLEVGNSLSRDEVKALAFLCTDLLGRNPNSVDTASDLFSCLADQDYLSVERPHLLIELLLTIRRHRLVSDLNLADQQSATTGRISAYRKLLYELSEDITVEDLKQMKFLLSNTLPRRKLEDNVTTLELFLEMEHMDHLSDMNLDKLETIIQSVCPVLKDKINQFNTRQTQETGQPMSSSFAPNQSSDRQIRDEYEETLQQLSSLSAETESRATSTDRNRTMEILPEENKVIVTTQHTNSEDLGSYPMTGAKRGVCLIINNYKFTAAENIKNREGTAIDEQCLRNVFAWLGFETDIQPDCTGEKMRFLLQELGRRDHSQMDSVACCILSHGQEGSVLGVDGQAVALTELRQPLNGLNCPSLANKPKLFFIQACQGTKEQQPAYIQSDGQTDSSVCVDCDAVSLRKSIPCDADFLSAMSTLPSFASFRDRKHGSWFIQSLCQNLVRLVPRGYDLVSILTKVNADVNQKTDSTGVKKQMPQPQFTLRKKVVFPPPKAAPPSLPSV